MADAYAPKYSKGIKAKAKMLVPKFDHSSENRGPPFILTVFQLLSAWFLQLAAVFTTLKNQVEMFALAVLCRNSGVVQWAPYNNEV